MSLMTTSEEEQLMFKYVGNDPQEHTEKNETVIITNTCATVRVMLLVVSNQTMSNDSLSTDWSCKGLLGTDNDTVYNTESYCKQSYITRRQRQHNRG